jgi:hypothetical protein
LSHSAFGLALLNGIKGNELGREGKKKLNVARHSASVIITV